VLQKVVKYLFSAEYNEMFKPNLKMRLNVACKAILIKIKKTLAKFKTRMGTKLPVRDMIRGASCRMKERLESCREIPSARETAVYAIEFHSTLNIP
jgi:hypothetical protein